MSASRLKRHGMVGRRNNPDVDRMAYRPYLEKQRESAQGYQDAKRITAFVFGRTLLGETVTEKEVSILLANSRSRVDTMRNTRRPTAGERERARLALQLLCDANPKLRRNVVFDVEEPEEPDAET